MSASLPSEQTQSVNDFGLGTYDSVSDEDAEVLDPPKRNLPDGGGSIFPDCEINVSYPLSSNITKSKSILPGDQDSPPPGPRPEDKTKDIVADSELPSGGGPAARSDYYDRMTMGTAIEEIWADEDSGVFAADGDSGGDSNQDYASGQQNEDVWADEDTGAYAHSQLPQPATNETGLDNFLGALGNMWSGFTIEDSTNPMGFPSPEFENSRSAGYNERQSMTKTRMAVNLELVDTLTTNFIKKYGKKDIVKRHVLAFLQEEGQPQYLSSDIIRCLKHRHQVTIPDVLDTFPVKKTASNSKISNIWEKLVDLEIQNVTKPEVANSLRRCAADIAHVMAGLERLEKRHGK